MVIVSNGIRWWGENYLFTIILVRGYQRTVLVNIPKPRWLWNLQNL